MINLNASSLNPENAPMVAVVNFGILAYVGIVRSRIAIWEMVLFFSMEMETTTTIGKIQRHLTHQGSAATAITLIKWGR